jgi:RHS repeat-associated protein
MQFPLRMVVRRLAIAAVIAIPSSLLFAAAPVWAADFTWTGAAPVGEPNWSNGANWEGGVAPSGSIGALTFPTVAGGLCTTTCYTSDNNIADLVTNSLTIGDTYYDTYYFLGDALGVGAEGIKVAAGARANIEMMPLNLVAPQTWSLGESVGEPATVAVGDATGASEALTIALSGGSTLTSANSANIEAGPVTITGANSSFSGAEASRNGEVTLGGAEEVSEVNAADKNAVHVANASSSSSLNATDKNAVNLTDASLSSFDGDIGPLKSTGALVNVKEALTVAGGVTLDSASELEVYLGSQLTASGNVNLGNAELSLTRACSAPPLGEAYTLVSTSGSVSGTFSGMPNGSTVEQKGGYCSNEYDVLRIDYTTHAVTATVVRSSYNPPPEGGALTLLELLSGVDNPSEFCPMCFLGRLISFVSPVDAPTGNFWHTFDDLSVPGRGIPLDLTRTYNSMSAATDGPFGFGWSFSYDMSLSFPDATHVVVNQENGSQVTFTEQSGGTYTAPPRVTATLVHNEDGSWTFVRRHRDTFSFNGSGKLTQEKDLNGYVTALAYNGSGQITTVTDPAGRKLTFAYTGNHISSVTDPLGRVVKYAYDEAGDLTDVTDANGGNTHFTYDSEHRMLTMRFPDQAPGVPGSTGAVVSNKYDAQGRVIEQTDQLGRTTKFAYSGEPLGAVGGTTTITDPKGNVTVQNYQYGELLSETKGYGTPQAATWTFGYDPATLGMTSVTDPDGHTTTSTFDSEGNTLTTTDALGRTTSNTYDSLNDLLTTTDPLGVTTTMTYDTHGNLLSTSRPLTGASEVQTMTYTYGDPSHPGDVTAMTDPEGNTWKYTYDADGDRTSTTDPLGDTTTSTYNAIGWLMSTTSPRGNVSGANPASFTTTYAYNNFGQITETVDPLGHKTTSQYDPDQNLIASIDADGNTTTYTYDAADEQTAVHRADGTALQTTYWPDGSAKEQIDGAGHATNYEYDPLGRVSAVTDPLGRTTRYGYDAAGNRITVTDPAGRITTTTYDAANEPTSITYSDGKTPNVTGITYDADGERTGETDGSGTWSWTWDSLHRLTSVTEGNNGTVKYQYDLRNDVTGITYPDGHTVTRGYDAASRWTSVTDWLGNTTTFAYNPDGDMTTETLPAGTGITDTSTYANDDTLSSINDKRGAETLFATNYSRDANGQLTGDSSQPESESGYGYTALNQLCYVGTGTGSCTSPPSGAAQYQYNSTGNLTRMGATTQTFDAADELTNTSALSRGGEPGGGNEPGESNKTEGNTPGAGEQVKKVTGETHPNGGTLAYTEQRALPTLTSGKVTFAHTSGRGGKVSQLVSTRNADDLLLAFVSAKEPRRGGQRVASIKGGGLKWHVMTSESFPSGYVSVWQAKASQRLRRTRVTVNMHTAGLPIALAVVGFDSGASVASGARASQNSGAAHVTSIVPADAIVWAVGQDALEHTKLKPLQGQAVVTKVNAPGGAVSWLQTGAPLSAGRLVLGDSTPRSSSWALGAVTIQERSAVAAKLARRAAPPLEATLTAGKNTLLAPLASPPHTAVTGVRPLASPSANETSTFSYDADGDRTGFIASDGMSQSYSYNQALELTGIGSEVSYIYNGDGLRISKTVGSATTPFTWDVASELPSLLEDGANAYVYGPGELPLEQVSGNIPLWFVHDQLGSTRLLTNATGSSVATYTYTPYGSVTRSSGTASTPLLYAGQYRDSESGMYYMRARYYDPSTAQFLTRDPAVALTRSPYSYAGDNPSNMTDPTGRWCFPPWSSSCEVNLPLGVCIANGAPTCNHGATGYQNLQDNLTDPNPPGPIAFVRSFSGPVSLGTDIGNAIAGRSVPTSNWVFDALGFVPFDSVAAGGAHLAFNAGDITFAVRLWNLSNGLHSVLSNLTIGSVLDTFGLRAGGGGSPNTSGAGCY